MIFQETWMKVLLQIKTQTRRLVAPSHFARRQESPFGGWITVAVVDKNEMRERIVYEDGKTYAVQPGRGKGTLYYKRTASGLSVWDHASLPKNPPKGVKTIDDPYPLRIRITDIRREDVRNISEEDAKAEGFANAIGFWEVWSRLNDKPANKKLANLRSRTAGGYYPDLHRIAGLHLAERPAALYDAWVLTFEVANHIGDFRQAFEEAMSGKTHPVRELWDDV